MTCISEIYFLFVLMIDLKKFPFANMTSRDWNPGDLVWAKMKGFSHWPALIVMSHKRMSTESKNPKQYVFFLGSHNYAWVIEKDIIHHSEEILESSKKSNRKSTSWTLALQETQDKSLQAKFLREITRKFKKQRKNKAFRKFMKEGSNRPMKKFDVGEGSVDTNMELEKKTEEVGEGITEIITEFEKKTEVGEGSSQINMEIVETEIKEQSVEKKIEIEEQIGIGERSMEKNKELQKNLENGEGSMKNTTEIEKYLKISEGSLEIGENSADIGKIRGGAHIGEKSTPIVEGNASIVEVSAPFGEGSTSFGEGSSHILEGSMDNEDESMNVENGIKTDEVLNTKEKMKPKYKRKIPNKNGRAMKNRNLLALEESLPLLEQAASILENGREVSPDRPQPVMKKFYLSLYSMMKKVVSPLGALNSLPANLSARVNQLQMTLSNARQQFSVTSLSNRGKQMFMECIAKLRRQRRG